MRKTILLFLIICSTYGVYAQGYKAMITYRATLDHDDFIKRYLDDPTIPEEKKQAMKNEFFQNEPVNFYLFVNGNEASYQPQYDLASRQNPGVGFKWNQTSLIAQDFNAYYANIGTNENFYACELTKEVLVDIGEVAWTLTQETKKIGDYTCYKAIAGPDSQNLPELTLLAPVVAWYVPEIPISFGIQNFNGLPGLILELVTEYDKGKVFYTATKIELNPKEEIKIKRPKERRHISEKDYKAMIQRLDNARKSNRP